MKIKLKESQIINILKNKEVHLISEEEENVMLKVLSSLGDLKVSNMWSSILKRFLGGDDSNEYHPDFNGESADEKNISQFDFLPVTKTKISSPFGPRNMSGKPSMHDGIDFATPSGTEIFTPAAGIVVTAQDSTPNRCGGLIKIKHKDYETVYCHVRQWLVKPGEQVMKGQKIGYTGGGSNDPHSGNSTGPHLHYSIKKDGKPINPKYVHSALS